MLKLNKYFIAAFCALIFLFGCRGLPERETEILPRQETEEEPRDFAFARPGVQRHDELTVVFSRHNMELDFRKSYFASEAQLFTALYEGLFSYHPLTLEPVPAMAERWALSDDRMQWTFTIRQNARFCNGDPVTAYDFRASWLSLLEPAREAPYSSFFDIIVGARDFRNGIEKDPEKVGIQVLNPRTLVVRLNSPASFFPAMLCHHAFSPIHHSMIDNDDWSSPQTHVGNGPFRLVSMDEDSIVMHKNEYYWDSESVALNKITIRFADTALEASRLWNSGEARWIAGNVDIEALTDRSGIQFNIMFATHYYFIRSSHPPWDDKRVRRAMALVLPWEEIRSAYILPAQSLIFPIAGYPRVEGITEPNYEEALELMAQAGFEDGEGLPELVIRITPSQDAARVAALMANAWQEILKFDVRIDVVPFELYFSSLRDDDFTVASLTWIGDFADPYAFLKMWRSGSNLNDARFSDPDFEALVDRSMREEGAVRFATLAEAERLLLHRAAVLPICFTPALNIVDMNELGGWFPNPLDIHPFKYLWFRTFSPLPGLVMGQAQDRAMVN